MADRFRRALGVGAVQGPPGEGRGAAAGRPSLMPRPRRRTADAPPPVPLVDEEGDRLLTGARTLFVSDVHMGARAAKCAELARLLHRVEPQTLYLVGDMIDLWRMRQRVHWPREANRVVRRIVALAESGTRVVYVPGNHDDLMRDYAGRSFAGIAIERTTTHVTAAGERLWILHGDEYDLAIRHSRVAAMIGSTAYETLVELDMAYKRARRMLGMRPTSLAHAVKMGSKRVATSLSNFERTLQREAATRGFDGVVCGHVHIPAVVPPLGGSGTTYYNTGDWRESCTALIEDPDGRLHLIRDVHGRIRTMASGPRAAAAA
jgi:UDP-2,3-diacylglucosamine pyrophosphatase LpxH